MNSWVTKKLGDISEMCLGKMLDKNKNKGELEPYLANINVRWGSFDLSNLKQMRFEKSEEDRYGLRYGDLVICEGGEPGRCAIWKDEIPGMKIQKALHRVRVHKDFSHQFIYYRLLLAGRNGELYKHFIGSTIQHLTGIGLKQVEFSYPPLLDQQKIAAVLSALDAKIEMNNRINAELEAMAKTLYDYWFVQFDFPDKNGKPYKSSGGKMVYNEELKREIPEGWNNCLLQDVVTIHDAKRIPLSAKERKERQGIYPYYGATSIMDYVDNYLFDGIYLLLAEDGSVMDDNGKPILQYIWGKTWVNNHAHVLEGIDNFSNEYLHIMLKTIPVIRMTTGSIQKKINQANLKQTTILRPKSEMLNSFQCFLKPNYQKRINLTKENYKLTQLSNWLLPMLMNGQVTVQ